MAEDNTHSSSSSATPYLPIGDYALIGDLHTVALVGMNGSIDWCCIPRFNSPSVFGALLDTGKGGFFRISPSDMSSVQTKQGRGTWQFSTSLYPFGAISYHLLAFPRSDNRLSNSLPGNST